MLSKWSFTVAVFCLLSGLCLASRAVSQSAPPAPATQAGSQQQPGATQSGYVLKVTTRLVTMDLIATDSKGNPVRDLKPEELQIFEGRKAPQKIEHFEFFDKLLNAGGSASAARNPENTISNQLPLEQLKIPPTVVLMDSLNTQTPNQQQGRAHMVQLLRSLPADTPVAVFVLGSSLRILQEFTSDPAPPCAPRWISPCPAQR